MPAEIEFQLAESVVERLEVFAGIARRRIVGRDFAEPLEGGPLLVVLGFHLPDGIGQGSAAELGPGAAVVRPCFDLTDIGKENPLFLVQVYGDLIAQAQQRLFQAAQRLVVVLAVGAKESGQEDRQPGQMLPEIDVVGPDDAVRQFREGEGRVIGQILGR